MDKQSLLKHSQVWDRVGLGTSIVCLIHCLAVPVVAAFAPMLNESVHEFFHWAILPLTLVIALISFAASYRKHRHGGPIILGSVGITIFVMTLLSTNEDDLILSTVASALLISAHLWNLRICHCFCEETCDHDSHDHDHAHDHNHSLNRQESTKPVL